MPPSRPSRFRPHLEQLEARENPAAALLSEAFDALAAPALPPGWTNWSNAGGTQFITSKLQAASGALSLASLGGSGTTARFWAGGTYTADAGVGVSVRSDSPASLEVIARGSNLNTAAPTYVTAVAKSGGGVELVQVSNGTRTSLGKATPAKSLPYSGVWLKVTVQPVGDAVSARVQRADTGEYLTAAGGWQSAAVDAISAKTSVKPGTGQAGVGRLTGGSGMAYLDDFVVTPPPAVGYQQAFDTTAAGLPVGWQGWASDGTARAAVCTDRSFSPANGLGVSGTSDTSARAWYATATAADSSVTAEVYADSLVPAGVLVRGANLNTAAPTYYALAVTRGLSVQLTKVVNGVEIPLGALKSAGYVSGQWVRVTLRASGDSLRALVYRTDTKQWLSADGSWQGVPEPAFEVTDKTIARGGFAGVARAKLAVGTVWLDDFEVRPAGSNTGPAVSVSASQAGTTYSDVVTFTAAAAPAGTVARVEYRLDGVLAAVSGTAPATWELDTTAEANGPHTLTVRALDADGSSATASLAFGVKNARSTTAPTRPDGVHKYSFIRLAQLAYAGNPVGQYELDLAKTSLDLIVPNATYLTKLEAAAPDTTKVIYTNLSNLYGGLLTDWLGYADATGASREAAFFHVAQATAYNGQSAASVPVREFWQVARGPTDATAAARGGGTAGVPFGGAGQGVSLGYPDRFRELNVSLQTASSGWAGRIEYASEVNADGSAKSWKTLPLLSNTTNGFTADGQLLFDPPTDWKPARVNGGQLLYHVRIVTTAGTGPTAKTLFGRDYTGAGGGARGTIPAFDAAADKNGDGYLNDAEYAARTKGFDARFVSESRLFYPYYGAMRFVTNPTSVSVRRWAADYHTRMLAANPAADGFFVDNSNGKLPFAATAVKESTATFTQDFAAAVGALARALPGKWVVANTTGSNAEGNAVAKQATAAFEEFVLRPNDHNWANFADIADLVQSRLSADRPSPDLILDTNAGSGSARTERTRMGALAYYYLLGDPDKTFLMFFGGSSPAAAWRDVFVPAATVDVGRPLGGYTTFATGADPQNAALTYKVFGRQYQNALVLYKPLSYALGKGTGTNDQATATTQQLGGSYRRLYSDGTLGAVVTSVSLMNGEGAVLMKA